MKINKEFVLREIAGEHMLVPAGSQAKILDGIIALNPAAAVIWNTLCENEDEKYVLQVMLDTFEVSEEEAKQDLQEFMTSMKEQGLLTEE